MNSSSIDSIDTAVNDIQSISEQLETLRGGIEQYANASNKLSNLSESLESLSTSLHQLPNSLSVLSKRGEALVEDIQNALDPAGILLSDVKQISSYVGNLPSKELLVEKLDYISSNNSDSTRIVQESLNKILQTFEVLSAKLESDSKKMSSKLDDLLKVLELHTTLISNIHEITDNNNKRLDEIIKLDKSNADETRESLSVLDKLARRSLFAILFGRDSGA